MKERLKLHNLRIDHAVIRSELKYSIGARNVDSWGAGLCGNPLQQFGSGLEPHPEPTWEFGPVANTNHIRRLIILLHRYVTQYDPLQLSSHSSSSPDSPGCMNAMPCAHLKWSSIHALLLRIEESYAGARIFIHILSAPFGQHRGLINVASFLLVHLVQVRLVVFYMHWL